jgi:spermidine synthase
MPRVLFVAVHLIALTAHAELLLDTRSKYSHIRVDEAGGVRHLRFDEVTQSTVKLGDPKHLVHDYTQTSMLGLALTEPKRVLVIGLGGGSMPMFIRAYYPSAAIDVVDIDPMVVELAKKYFEYKEDGALRTFVADGATFVGDAKAKYDLVFLDAYSPDFIPPQLATPAFFAKVKALLAQGGVLVSNVWGPPNPAYDPMIATQRSVFKNLYIVHARQSGNHIFVAGERPVTKAELVQKTRTLQKQKGFDFDLSAIVDGGWQP